jgi:hypothetical protein
MEFFLCRLEEILACSQDRLSAVGLSAEYHSCGRFPHSVRCVVVTSVGPV